MVWRSTMRSLTLIVNMRKLWLGLASIAISVSAPNLFGQTAAQLSPVAPTHEQVQTVVTQAYNEFKNDQGGKNADYIPALAQVDPKLYGIVAVSTDGQMVSDGDVNHSFSIQSISKVFTLALAMNELGADKVFAK